MGLFDKKFCSVCGAKIGLLGNRKLEDGNLCKDCARKLSPWFDERRHSTVQQIQEQLAYREANRSAVSAFRTSRTLGRDCKVLIDEAAGKFMVTSARNLEEANPDVLELAQVTGCNLDIHENSREDMREIKDSDGKTKRISYVPQRYIYEYDFYIQIYVNTPYFDEIRFRLNSSSVVIHYISGRPMFDPMKVTDYAAYYNMGEEIKAALTQLGSQMGSSQMGGSQMGGMAAAEPVSTSVTCPWCGAVTTPDPNGRCEHCGGSVNA